MISSYEINARLDSAQEQTIFGDYVTKPGDLVLSIPYTEECIYCGKQHVLNLADNTPAEDAVILATSDGLVCYSSRRYTFEKQIYPLAASVLMKSYEAAKKHFEDFLKRKNDKCKLALTRRTPEKFRAEYRLLQVFEDEEDKYDIVEFFNENTQKKEQFAIDATGFCTARLDTTKDIEFDYYNTGIATKDDYLVIHGFDFGITKSHRNLNFAYWLQKIAESRGFKCKDFFKYKTDDSFKCYGIYSFLIEDVMDKFILQSETNMQNSC